MDEEFAEYARTRYAGLVRQASLILGRDRDYADDLVQDALIRLYTKIRVGDVQNFDALVRTIMVNLAVSRWRRETLFKRALPKLQEVSHHRADDLVDKDPIWYAIEDLPIRQRAIVVLRYYEDLSDKSIALVMGIDEGTVRSQSFKARAKLRAALEDFQGVDHE